jgi:hypothetical protein
MHLGYVHRTRTVAILSIVAMHCDGRLDRSENFQTIRLPGA